MGDVIKFDKNKRRKRKDALETLECPMIWGDGPYGFNPECVRSIFIANGTDICFIMHDVDDQNYENEKWEFMVRFPNAEMCNMAFDAVVKAMKDTYGIILE